MEEDDEPDEPQLTVEQANALSRAFARAFAAIAPPGLSPVERDDGLWLLWDDGTGMGIEVNRWSTGFSLWQLLDQLATMMSEETTEPWPATTGDVKAGEPVFPEPFVWWVGRELRVGYGDPEAPVLALAPLAWPETGPV